LGDSGILGCELARVRDNIDWEGVERDYRAGIATLRQIAETYGTTHTTVANRAKAGGWDRDLSAKIAAKAEALLSKNQLSTELDKPTEKAIVESNARVVAIVALAHRNDIKKLRDLASGYSDDLDALRDDDEPVPINELAQRVSILKALSEVTARLVTVEREAYGMDKGDPIGADAVVQIVRRIVG